MNRQELMALGKWLQGYKGRKLKLMEVCGTHTAALYTTGIRSILPENISLVSGPGCPVCVTPSGYIDKLAEYAFRPGYAVMTFGDMLRVPGSKISLSRAKALGGRVEYFYSPEEALIMAGREPETCFVLGAVGFETTAAVWASLVLKVVEEGVKNLRFLLALKTMPIVMGQLCSQGKLDGFLCPGHVAVITGCRPFRELAKKYSLPLVVGGFEREHLLLALCRLVLAARKRSGGFWNEYASVVREDGNPLARKLMNTVFRPGPALWRGFGNIEGSGLYLKGEYASLDAGSEDLPGMDSLPPGCCCDKVLLGEMTSEECPCFGKVCRPEHPLGACMVSSEGSCAIKFLEGRKYGD